MHIMLHRPKPKIATKFRKTFYAIFGPVLSLKYATRSTFQRRSTNISPTFLTDIQSNRGTISVYSFAHFLESPLAKILVNIENDLNAELIRT